MYVFPSRFSSRCLFMHQQSTQCEGHTTAARPSHSTQYEGPAEPQYTVRRPGRATVHSTATRPSHSTQDEGPTEPQVHSTAARPSHSTQNRRNSNKKQTRKNGAIKQIFTGWQVVTDRPERKCLAACPSHSFLPTASPRGMDEKGGNSRNLHSTVHRTHTSHHQIQFCFVDG